jgi:hypothetical protein
MHANIILLNLLINTLVHRVNFILRATVIFVEFAIELRRQLRVAPGQKAHDNHQKN